MRLPDYGLDPGCKADLNVLDAPTFREVLRLQQPHLWVMREGNVLVRNEVQRKFMR